MRYKPNEHTDGIDDSLPPVPFEVDLRIIAVGPERVTWLGALIENAYADLCPRDFTERHLVDEMAVNKWRLLRVYAMEKAVYEHQAAAFRPVSKLPHEDLYHLAQANSPIQDGIILAALGRLEARFHRQFYAALKMFIALRRFNPVPLPNHDREGVATSTPSPQSTSKAENQEKEPGPSPSRSDPAPKN